MLEKTYQPADIEARIHAAWMKADAFKAGRPERADAASYCIVIPPPNVTGSLHMGHALNNTLQDVLCRFERMRGKDVLWQPGTDHAGIATQLVVERQLMERQQGDRHKFGRDKFIEKVWAWKAESGGTITNQLKRLGASCDWSRERFTMDEGMSKAVLKVFVDLYNAGLIYKDKRLANWDPAFQSAISDLEVEMIEVKGSFNWTAGDPDKPFDAKALGKVLDRNPSGHLYHFRYPLKDGVTYRFPTAFGEDGKPTAWEDRDYIVVATTRPETMLGDTAVAVHPEDERYKALVGKMVVLPLVGREIPIVADEYSDPTKGSGAVKITPAHDFNDYPGRQAARSAGHQHPGCRGAAQRRGAREVSRPRPVRRAQAGGRRPRRARPGRKDRGARACGSARAARQRGRRAVADRPVVRRRRRAGEAGYRRGRERPHQVRPEELGEDLLRVDAQHRALVHLAPDLVGASDPGVVWAWTVRYSLRSPKRRLCWRRDGNMLATSKSLTGRRHLRMTS